MKIGGVPPTQELVFHPGLALRPGHDPVEIRIHAAGGAGVAPTFALALLAALLFLAPFLVAVLLAETFLECGSTSSGHKLMSPLRRLQWQIGRAAG